MEVVGGVAEGRALLISQGFVSHRSPAAPCEDKSTGTVKMPSGPDR